MRVWVISAAGSVDEFGKVNKQSERNVLTFRTERVGKIIIMFLMTQNTKKWCNEQVLEPANYLNIKCFDFVLCPILIYLTCYGLVDRVSIFKSLQCFDGALI